MAFSSSGNAGASVSQGPALSEVQTEGLGFLSIAGDAKVRLTAPWSPPPAQNATLMSIASRRGLVAAASPDAVVIASTDAVRKAFESSKDGDSEIRSFTPQMTLALPMRICQVAFSSDEAYLVLSAEQGGGLAAYDVNALQQGSTQTTFEIPTNGESLRALVPNPSPEMAQLCAVVTDKGKLLVANLKERNFVAGANGQVLQEQVSSIAWSNKGKQLVAGLGDGTMRQFTPEGVVKAEIPRPPELDPSFYVSAISWLENDLFLVFHVSTANGTVTKCHLISRQSQSFQFQGLNDPVDPFGADKVPHHTAVRLRNFPPNLQDLLIFSSSAVPDIGLLARSKTPLAPNGPVDVFTNIELADDSRRATLPMGEDLESPAAIGVCLDLSGKDKVYKPIPADELDESPGPLPGLWVLNDQGILSVWWVVYSESIRGGTTYPGLSAEEASNNPSVPALAPPTNQSNPFAKPASPFGGTSTATAAFGAPSLPGAKSSPWATNASASTATGGAVFGSPSFGSNSASGPQKPVFGVTNSAPTNSPFSNPDRSSAGPAWSGTGSFGQASTPAAKVSPWAAGGTSAASPAFGQSGFAPASGIGAGTSGSAASSKIPSSGGGFSSFANQGGFAAFASNAGADKPSIFGSPGTTAPEVSMSTESTSSFPAPSSKPATTIGNPFGSQPFKLTSSFKPDPTKESDDGDDKTIADSEKSFFGSGFVSSIKDSTKPTPSIFGGGGQGVFGKSSPDTVESTTPTSTPAPNKFLPQAPGMSAGNGPFSFPSTSLGGLFGNKSSASSETKPTTAAEEGPLPPESTNDSGAQNEPSNADDLPLPPDSPTSPSPATKTPEKAVVTTKATSPDSPPPPLPGNVTSTKKPANDVPLPRGPTKKEDRSVFEPPPLPGASGAKPPPLPSALLKQPKANESKPSAISLTSSTGVAGPGFKFPTTLPPVSDSDDETGDGEGSEDGSEGSGVDVAKDLSPPSTSANRTPGFTPQSSFDGLAGGYTTISRFDSERRSIFGAPVFPQPSPISPRSPSPVRAAVPRRPLAMDQQRSFTAPNMASQILAASKKQPQSRLNSSIMARDAAFEDAVITQQRKAKAKKEEEEAQLLVDEEDDAVQRLLEAEVEPTLDLDEFIAHAGVVPPAGDSVPAQVEAVYRDINSMMDTLGLNTRSLRAFIEGQREYSSDERSKLDLASPDEWTLEDIGKLTYIVDKVLGGALEGAKVTNVEQKVAEVHEIQRELARDCNKQADVRKTIASRIDPDQAAAYQSLPLSAEQAAQQSDLRRQLSHFQTLLARAEEDISLLKAKIVSAHSVSGRGGPVPTVDAIVRTISKLTSMVEKRSGDIDVLENQMRKLRVGSVGPSGSREGSPFATPSAKKTLGSSIFSPVFSPERSTREGTPMRGSIMRHSLSGSVSGDMFRTPPRKKLSGFGDAERKAVKEKRERRAAILGKLRSSIENKGPSIITMEDAA